jgi:hypothetical protein
MRKYFWKIEFLFSLYHLVYKTASFTKSEDEPSYAAEAFLSDAIWNGFTG